MVNQRLDRRPKVVYWNNQPAPYVVDWFNAISDTGAIDFEAWFDVEREPDRNWDITSSRWRFRYRYLRAKRVAGLRLRMPVEELQAERPDVFVQSLNHAVEGLGLCVGRVYSGRVTLRTLPSYKTWYRVRYGRELMKHFLIRGIDGAHVSGPDGRAWIGQYGLPAPRTWQTRHGVDVGHFGQYRSMPAEQRASVRGRLGLEGTVFLYVGRLWYGKGVDVLIESFRHVCAIQDKVSLLIVGSGPEEESLRQRAAGTNVVFVGDRQPAELPKMYALADVLVFPTLGDPHGIVVEEAMAAGLPVISTTSAGNISYRITPGLNGYLVSPNSVEELANAMSAFASLPSDERASLSAGAAEFAASATPDRYANDFLRFVEGVMETRRRSTISAYFMRLVGYAVALIWRLLPTTDL